MSTINVDVVSPQSGDNVEVNGLKITGSINIGLGNDNTTASTTSGEGNIGVGNDTLATVSTGYNNIGIGYNSLNSQSSGSANVGIGASTLSLSTGNWNVAVGNTAGEIISTGAKNVLLGDSAGDSLTTGDNNIIIGWVADASTATVSNSITLGNSYHDVLRCAVTSITSLSDSRDKKEITELSAGLDFVKGLKPVEFVWNERDEEGRHDIKDFGFIAQDLTKSQEDAGQSETLKLVYESNPEKLEASYGKLIPILVKAIQELSAKVEALEAKKK